VSMLNTRPAKADQFPSGADCFFQVEFDVSDPAGQAIFREYRITNRSLTDPEESALELLYRKRRAYAAGHGCAPEWGEDLNGRMLHLLTLTGPAFKVAPVDPRSDGEDELSMYFLSGANDTVSPERIPAMLGKLAKDYDSWIKEREAEIPSLLERLHKA